MPWKEKSARSERARFLKAVRTGNENFSQVCRSFGISRKTGYKWLRRAEKEGNEQLSDRRRGRRSGADREQMVGLILRQKKSHPFWGSKKLTDLVKPPTGKTRGTVSFNRSSSAFSEGNGQGPETATKRTTDNR
jgi:transposase